MKNTYTEVMANLETLKGAAERAAGLLPQHDAAAQHSVGIRVRVALEELEMALERLEEIPPSKDWAALVQAEQEHAAADARAARGRGGRQ